MERLAWGLWDVGDLAGKTATIKIVDKAVGLDIGGNRVAFDVAEGKLNRADVKPVDGKVSMQVIVDRPMIEICGNDGAVYITSARGKRGDVSSVEAFAEGGAAELLGMEVHELESIWRK